jgi:hypothetical protein
VRGTQLKKIGLVLVFLGILLGTNVVSFDGSKNEFIIAGTPAKATTGGRTNSFRWHGSSVPCWNERKYRSVYC